MIRRGLAWMLALVLGVGTALGLTLAPVGAQETSEPGTWNPMGPEGGAATALALSPDFATNGVAFGGNAYVIRQIKTGLGLFKSTDGGCTWLPSATTVATDTRITGVEALAVSPDFSADQTVFAGTRDYLYTSTDAGATWRQVKDVGSLLVGVSAVALAPDYATSGHVMATSGNTLYVSENRGISWTTQSELGLGGVLAYSPDFANDRTAFVGGNALWRTVNGGITWTQVLSKSTWAVAVSPDFADDRTLFAGGLEGRLNISYDAGTTWMTRTLVPTVSTVNALVTSPDYVTDTTLFAGCHSGLYRSEDGGVTWTPEPSFPPGVRVEVLAISPDWPADPTLLVGTPAGIYRTDDGGATYTRHGFTLTIPTLTSAQSGRRLFAGSDRQGLFQSPDAGAHWTPAGLYGKAFIDVATAPAYSANPSIFASVVAGAGMGLYRSEDAGQTWDILGSMDSPGGYWALSPAYAQDGTVFVTGDHGDVLRSTDRGATWKQVGTWPPGVSGPARLVLLGPDYPADPTLWAAGRGVWRLDPGATTWISSTLPVPNAEVTDIARSPDFHNDRTLLATGYGRDPGTIIQHYTVFRSTDAGATWSTATLAFSDTTPLVAVAFSPRFAADQTAFVVTEDQLFRSSDGGRRWVAVGAPADAPPLHDVVAHGFGRASVATEAGTWQYSTAWEETIINGGFEANSGWHFPTTPLPAAVTDLVTHTGNRAVRIGVGPGSPTPTTLTYSSVRQTLTIPSDTLTATLHFYYYPKSEEAPTANASVVAGPTAPVEDDLQYVMIAETDEFLFSGLEDASTWFSRTLDLSGYAGDTLTLVFGVVNDGEDGHTGMVLDDVSLLTRRLRPVDLTERIYLPLVLRSVPGTRRTPGECRGLSGASAGD